MPDSYGANQFFTSRSLRPGLSETAFRRYEAYIRSAIQQAPVRLAIHWTAQGLSHATFTARLRDAIRSFIKYRWPCDWYVPEVHDEILPHLSVRSDARTPQLVYILNSPVDNLRSKHTLPDLPSDASAATHVPALPEASHLLGTEHWSVLESSSYSLEQIAHALSAYSVLASYKLRNLGKLVVRKTGDGGFNDQIGELMSELENEYDIGVVEEDDCWKVF